MPKATASEWHRIRDPQVVGLALRVALVVGTILNVINHFDLLLGAPLTPGSLVQIGLTYLVPYCVSTHGQVRGRYAMIKADT
ncbi:MAG TPA: nitrate/nitrite transporter NrtS [Burkholderiales bacterium]|nr:nitrate/nitrite transporter NrtS [Burkholderiales bacterium]